MATFQFIFNQCERWVCIGWDGVHRDRWSHSCSLLFVFMDSSIIKANRMWKVHWKMNVFLWNHVDIAVTANNISSCADNLSGHQLKKDKIKGYINGRNFLESLLPSNHTSCAERHDQMIGRGVFASCKTNGTKWVIKNFPFTKIRFKGSASTQALHKKTRTAVVIGGFQFFLSQDLVCTFHCKVAIRNTLPHKLIWNIIS